MATKRLNFYRQCRSCGTPHRQSGPLYPVSHTLVDVVAPWERKPVGSYCEGCYFMVKGLFHAANRRAELERMVDEERERCA